jgi:alpha-galactosidase
MRRAVPVMRSDFVMPSAPEIVEGNQGHTYGLSFWLPWHGSEDWFTDTYSSRSFYLPGFIATEISDYMETILQIKKENVAALKRAYSECAEVAPFMLGDYYPLTPYNRDLSQWLAWQFNRPDKSDGMLQAFRRKNCTGNQITVKLQGLDAKATYAFKDFDPGTFLKTGSALMTEGLTVTLPEAPAATLLTYKKVRATK